MGGFQLAIYLIATYFAIRSLSSLMTFHQRQHSLELAKELMEESKEAQRAALQAEREAREQEALERGQEKAELPTSNIRSQTPQNSAA